MIEGKNVTLRTMKAEDIIEIVNIASKLSEFGEYWPISIPSLAKMQKTFNETGFWEDNNGRVIVTDKQGRILGEISYFKGLFYQEGLELGYRIYRQVDRNKGYLTEALRIFVDYLFALKPISRLQINIMKGNIASRKLAEKCGFKLDGVMREAVFHRGTYHDLEMFSLLKGECPPLSEVL